MRKHALATICLSLGALAGGCASNNPRTPDESSSIQRGEIDRAKAARICLTTAKDLDEHDYPDAAIGEYERARQLDPSLKGIARRLAVLYDRRNDDTRALQEYKNALAEDPYDPEVNNDFGYYFIVRNDGEHAEPYLRLAVTKAPKDERAWVNLGTALCEQHRYNEAYGAFARVMTPAQAWYDIGAIQAHAGDRELAKESLIRAMKADPSLLKAQHMSDMLRQHSASTAPTTLPTSHD
jgi:Tfp pilus assembly protein PilF